MKIFDMHIHTDTKDANPHQLIKAFEESGVFGGCIFSTKPKESNPETGMDFEKRLEQVFSWCKGYEDRLFPVLWIHPDEENLAEKIRTASDRGIAAFKMICDNYHIGDEKPMEALRVIASTGKPVIFHSGISYTYSKNPNNSQYNRPIDWEPLMTIPNLRFSMGHCSWPWTDECISLFGRIEYGRRFYVKDGEKPAEMYFDLTPGTPDIYREDLLLKLFQDSRVSKRLLWGTDHWAERYTSPRPIKYLNFDREIMDKLGVSIETRNNIYYQNFFRFLGREDLIKEEDCRFSDNDGIETVFSPKTAEICEKWYKKLNFPCEYDREFKDALSEYKISDAITIENYDLKEKDGKRNLLSFLFMCEDLSKKYQEKGINEEILLDTLGDLVRWTNTWSEVKNEMHLGELVWLSYHFNMRLFKLGSLQFAMGKAFASCPQLNLSKGDNIIEVHIPAGTSITSEECEKSFSLAKEFFAKYYPEFEYSHFTCHSWILDNELEKLLNENSNILKFKNSFTLVESEEHECYDALKYIFKWNTTKLNLRNAVCVSSFADRIKKHVMSGGKLNIGFGVRKK